MANSFSFEADKQQHLDRQIHGEYPTRFDLLTGDYQGSELLDELISNCCPKTWYDFLHHILVSTKSPHAQQSPSSSSSSNNYCYSFNIFSKFFQIWKSTLGNQHQQYKENNVYYLKTWLLHCQSHINDYQQNYKNAGSRKMKKQRLETISSIFRKLYEFRIGRDFSELYIEWAKYYIFRKKYKKAKKKIKLGIKYPVKHGMLDLKDFLAKICQKEADMISNSNNLAYLYEDSASSLSTFSESTYGQNTESENDDNAPSLKNNNAKMEVDIEQTRNFESDQQSNGNDNNARSSLSTLPQRLPQIEIFAEDTENDSDHFDDEEEETDQEDQENDGNQHVLQYQALPQISENAPISPLPKKHHLRTPFAAINPNINQQKNKKLQNLTVKTKSFAAPFTPNTLMRNYTNNNNKPFCFSNRDPLKKKENESPKKQATATTYTSNKLKQRQSTPYKSSRTTSQTNTEHQKSKHVQFELENKSDSYFENRAKSKSPKKSIANDHHSSMHQPVKYLQNNL